MPNTSLPPEPMIMKLSGLTSYRDPLTRGGPDIDLLHDNFQVTQSQFVRRLAASSARNELLSEDLLSGRLLASIEAEDVAS